MRTTDASHLRQNIYQLLDSVLETGRSLLVKRKKGAVEIRPISKKRTLDALTRQPLLAVDPETIIQNDWEKLWNKTSY